MNDHDARKKIADAIGTSSFRWRTPRGISKDSGVPIEKVSELLDRSDDFVKSRKGNARGEPLYTTTSKYKSETKLTTRLLGALSNKIIG